MRQNYNFKSETKKLNKKTLGAVFCALSLGVAGVTGLMLNDSNKKYDELKKDNAIQIEEYKTEKTALETQLEEKLEYLEFLENEAVDDANRIAQLNQEIETLRSRVGGFREENSQETLNIHYLNENGELDNLYFFALPRMTSCQRLHYLSQIDEIEAFEMEYSYNLKYDVNIDGEEYSFDVLTDTGSAWFDTEIYDNYEYRKELASFELKIKDVNGNDLDLSQKTGNCDIVDYKYNFEMYTGEELEELGVDSVNIIKKLTVTVNVDIEA